MGVLYLYLFCCALLDSQEEELADCFASIVLQMGCYCKCVVTRPQGAVDWSVVCDCGIS